MLADLQEALKKNQKLQITVWELKNDDVEFNFSSYVVDGAGMMYEVAPPGQQASQILVILQEGQTLGVVVETYPNPFIFYPILYRLPNSIKANWHLHIPDNPKIEVMNQRRHVRIPMFLSIEVEYQLMGKTFMMAARTEDLSGGGLKFTGVRPFAKGQEIIVHLKLNTQQPIMRLRSKVVFSAANRVKKQPDDLYATACQFIDLDDATEMIIVRACFHKELGIKR